MSKRSVPLILFTKIPGRTDCKTRLRDSSGMSKEEIETLALAFLADVLIAIERSTATIVYLASDPLITPAEHQSLYRRLIHKPSESFLSSIHLRPQAPLPFDKRLSAVIREAANGGGAVIVGSDAPLITDKLISEALETVQTGKAVLGPAPHGGVYLIGIPGEAIAAGFSLEGAFESETKTELEALSDRFVAAGCAPLILPMVFDIDVKADLLSVMALVSAQSSAGGSRCGLNTHAAIVDLGLRIKRSTENNREPELARS